MATRIQIRRGKTNQWGSANPLLSEGEIGVETDTLKMKIGDGSSRYKELRYIDENDEIYLGKWELPTGWAGYEGFDKLCDIFGMRSHNVNRMYSADLIVRVFDQENGAIGSCGPGLEKDEIMEYLAPMNENKPIIVKFYVKTVGDEVHTVLYNETYGALLGGGGLKESGKRMFLDQSDILPMFLDAVFKKLYNKTLNEYDYDNAIKCFRSVGKEKLGMFNNVGRIDLGQVIQTEAWWFYDTSSKNFVPYSGSLGGDTCHQIDNYFIKHGKWRKDEYSSWEEGIWIDSDPNNFPEDLVDLQQTYYDLEYISWGVACLHILSLSDNERYRMFKIGGCGNDKLSMTIENQIHQIGLNANNYICYPYIEYYSTRRNKTLKVMDEYEIDCSYPFGIIQEGCKPFKYRLRAWDIEHYIKCIKRSDAGTAKFRLGIYNPQLNKFSKPSRWMRIRKQYGIADIHMSFVN